MDTLKLAQGLLDNEMEEFDHNPTKYVESLGWNKELQNKSIDLSGKLSISSKDYENLQTIIDKQLEENLDLDTLSIAESNSVSDFVTNCIAGKIKTVFDSFKNVVVIDKETGKEFFLKSFDAETLKVVIYNVEYGYCTQYISQIKFTNKHLKK